MNIDDCKNLVQHMLFSDSGFRFTNKELINKFPEFVEISRQKNPDTIVYRILMLEADQHIEDFKTESTSKNISSCLGIANNMPKILWGKEKMTILRPHIFKFKLPQDRVLIDFDAILPLLKERLNSVLKHNVYGKNNNSYKIEDAIKLYESANEKEVISNLEDLNCEYIEISPSCSTSIGQLVISTFENNEVCSSLLNYSQEWIDEIKPLLSEKEIEKSNDWLQEVNKAIEIKKSLDNLKPKKKKKKKKKLPKNK